MSTPNMSGRTDDANTENTLTAEDLLTDGKVDVSKVKSVTNNAHVSPHNAKVTPELCATLRNELAAEGDTDAVADRHDIGKTTLTEHAQGECNHDIETPPAMYGWVRAPDADDTGGNENYGEVTRPQCQRIRRQLLSGMSRNEVASDVRLGTEYVTIHATGECLHAPRPDGIGPVKYGWGVRPERFQ